MARAAVEEARSLLLWFKENSMYTGALGVTGMSMGGAFSCLVGGMTSFPIACIPCIPAHSPIPVLAEGVMSKVIDWKTLMEQSNLSLEETKKKLEEFLHPFCDTFWYLTWSKHPISCVSVSSTHDKFIPQHSIIKVQGMLNKLKTHYVEHRWIRGGHVSAILLHQHTSFANAIENAFKKLEQY